MTGLSVLVVDDEPLARRRAVRLVKRFLDASAIIEAGDADEARAALAAHAVDVLLLDIQMPGEDGFSLLESLSHPPPTVIFVTAFGHHALRAFEAQAVDYVTKPIEPGRLQAALRRAQETLEAQASQDQLAELQETLRTLRRDQLARSQAVAEFWVKTHSDYVRVPTTAITRFQSDRGYVQIHAGGETYLHLESLASLERRLDPDEFVRVHRGVIVRKNAIVRVKGAPSSVLFAVLEDGSNVRIGRTYVAAFRSGLSRRERPPPDE